MKAPDDDVLLATMDEQPTANADKNCASQIFGRVLSPDGGGVAGAQILALLPDGPLKIRPDHTGELHVSTLGNTVSRVEIEITAPGYTKSTAWVEICKRFEVIIARNETRSGAYAIEAEVRMRGTGAPCHAGHATLGHVAGVTVGTIHDGRVVFSGIEPGHYGVTVQCEQAALAHPDPVEVIANDVSGLVWLVQLGCDLEGIILDDKGHPVPEAVVLIDEADRRPQISAGDGTFSFEGLAPGSYSIAAASSATSASIRVTNDCLNPTPVSITLARIDTSLNGRVIDQKDQGVVGVEVRVHRGLVGDGQSPTILVTNDDGEFAGVIPAGDIVVSAVLPSPFRLLAQPVSLHLVPGESREIVLRIDSEAGGLKGRVLFGSGAPARAAMVHLAFSEGTGASLFRSSSDDSGRFRFRGLPPSRFRVCAEADTGRTACREPVHIGEWVELVVEDAGSIAGIVRGAESKNSFLITALHKNTRQSRSRIEEGTHGRFRFDDMPVGAYLVRADTDRATGAMEVEVPPGVTVENLEIVLASPVRVFGRILGAESRRPVEGLLVGFSQRRGEVFRTQSDGRFNFTNAGAGFATISITWNGEGQPRCSHERSIWVDPQSGRDLGDIFLQPMEELSLANGTLGMEIAQTRAGVVVAPIAGGPADKAGLQPGEVLFSINGSLVYEDQHLARCLLLGVVAERKYALQLGTRRLFVVASPVGYH